MKKRKSILTSIVNLASTMIGRILKQARLDQE